MKALIDSNIIIDFLNNHQKAVEELASRDALGVSIITYIEVLSGVKDLELKNQVKLFFNNFEIISVDKKIADEAIKIRSTGKLKLPDSLIIATALVHDVILLTRDEGLLKSSSYAKCPYLY